MRDNYCIDDNHKVLWVRVPRVASTSIKAAWYPGVQTRQDYSRAKRKNEQGYFTVMFVRDPISRFLSAWGVRSIKVRQFKPGLSIDKAINQLVKADLFEIDKHFRPQWTFAEGLRIDFVGQLTTIEDDWARLREITPVKGLPLLNESRSAKDILNQAQKDALKQIYAKDYEWVKHGL